MEQKVFNDLSSFSNCLKVYSNLIQDGRFNELSTLLRKVFDKEGIITISALYKKKQDFKKTHKLLIANSKIFKDNLKLIMNIIIEQQWSQLIKEEKVRKLILTHHIEKIPEEQEDSLIDTLNQLRTSSECFEKFNSSKVTPKKKKKKKTVTTKKKRKKFSFKK